MTGHSPLIRLVMVVAAYVASRKLNTQVSSSTGSLHCAGYVCQESNRVEEQRW